MATLWILNRYTQQPEEWVKIAELGDFVLVSPFMEDCDTLEDTLRCMASSNNLTGDIRVFYKDETADSMNGFDYDEC